MDCDETKLNCSLVYDPSFMTERSVLVLSRNIYSIPLPTNNRKTQASIHPLYMRLAWNSSLTQVTNQHRHIYLMCIKQMNLTKDFPINILIIQTIVYC